MRGQDTETRDGSPDPRRGRLGEAVESAPVPWLQALLVNDPQGPRTHLLVVRHSSDPPASDAPPANAARERDLALVRSSVGDDPRASQMLAERLACVPAMVRGRNEKLGAPLHEDEVIDVVQNTLVSVWSKLDRFQGRSALETWVYGFVIRELYKFLERRPSRGRRLDLDEERLESPSEEPETLAGDDFRLVHDGIQAIGPPGSDIILLKHFEQLTFEQIADELDMPVNTVKTRYYRSVARLRSMLEPVWRRAME